ncbi:MAG TPA: 2-C-methyl-D-erythritol 4-phosphate cytidylyltransferase [Sunxiuqinia sp.]|nr:2-C-methyl-D-erythritol 4-phosphate cytidylyltransferase [Sunxiuqinia sp.]
MKKFALIVAGGKGTRMGATVPKQFLKLAGKPILLWTIQRFIDFDPTIEIILVLPEDQFEQWGQICADHRFQHPVELAKGGTTRFQSVKNGLQKVGDSGIVFIHDGVRPLVSLATLTNCFQTALEKGNALPVAPVVESIRRLDGAASQHVDRSQYRLVQTPQTFQCEIVKKAYEQPEQDLFTDDASVCESSGYKINLVDGNVENIKLTNPIDLKIAEVLLVS